MDEGWLREVRDAELQLVLPFLRPRTSVLEIGAGSGWQARRLAELGFAVSAVDIHAPDKPLWEVCTYDGRVLPFPDSSFDHVFSSNALEHIDDLPRTMAEIRRVLKTGGSSVHLVPTATWRLWTSITHYPYMARQAARRLFGNSGRAREVDAIDSSAPLRLSNLLVAEKHGAHHSVLRELRAFSAGHWRRLLASGGNSITRFSGSGIYYSGYAVLGSMLDIRCRKRLSRLLGSSCHLVVLRHDA